MSESFYLERMEQWFACLKENGYRLTAPRRAVIESIASSQRILNPFQVHELAKKIYPQLGLVTVYRTIEKLEELSLLQRVHQPSNCHGFTAAFSGHQHLLICQKCGLVAYFSGDEEKMEPILSAVEQQSGYSIDDHWLQLFGLCNECQKSPDRLDNDLTKG